MQLRSRQRAPLATTLALIPRLVDVEGAPVRGLRRVPAGPASPRLCHVHAEAVGTRRGPRAAPTLLVGGSALGWDRATAKAVGEGVERASVMDWRPEVVLARACDLDAVIDITSFESFHPTQRQQSGFCHTRLQADTEVGWVRAWSLTRRADTYVPATLAHRFYEPQTAGDVFDTCPVSGYACGNSLEEALLGALCEVAERDALMLCWLQALPVPSLDLATFGGSAVPEMLERYRGLPLRLYCSDITTDIGIPSVLVMMTSTAPGWPAAAVATAADMSREQAVVKALCELASGADLVRSHQAAGSHFPQRFDDVVEPHDHALFYARPQALPYLDAFLRPRRSVSAAGDLAPDADVRVLLDQAVTRVAARGLEVLAVELTRPDVQAAGLHVVKVIVPGCLPIDFGRQPRHLGMERLYTAPAAMGYQRFATTPGGLNAAPHPFP